METVLRHLEVFQNLYITFTIFMAISPFDVLLIWWFILQKNFSHVEKQFDERYVIIICNDST